MKRASLRLRRFGRYALLFLTGVLIAIGIGGCALSAPRYVGPKSDHFDGESFHNLVKADKEQGFGSLIKWQLQRNQGPWRDFDDHPKGDKPPERVDGGKLRVTFINHATTLIQMDGLNVLTDPIWSERCSPFSFAGPKRHVHPGIDFDDLPPIDIVLLSHNHYDHMDVPTLKRLEEKFHPRFFVGLGNAKFLYGKELSHVQDMEWWTSSQLKDGVQLTSVPVQHFSNRGVFDRDGTLWTGFVLEGPSGKVFFAGDTGFGPHFQQIREKFGPMRLAVLPIGAFRPEWFMSHIHETPEEALKAHEILEAKTSVAIHFGTFNLADDGQDEAPLRLKNAIERAGGKANFVVLGFGEGRDVE